jgi:hypothetical protein
MPEARAIGRLPDSWKEMQRAHVRSQGLFS